MLCDCFVQDAEKYRVVQHTEPAQKDKREWTALHHAAYNNSVQDVETLLKQDPTQMFVKKGRDSALSLAVENGSVESFLCFMKYHLAESVRDNMLHIAIKHGQLGIVEAIVPYCSSVQLDMALDHATMYGHAPIVRALSRFIPSDFIVDKDDKQTLLHIAAMYNRLDVLQYLCSICSSDVIVAKDKHGDTLLFFAIKMSSFDIVKFVVDTYPQLLSIPNRYNNSALIESLIVKNYQVTYYLLDQYSHIMEQRNKLLTPLHLASCIHIATRLHALDPTMIDVVTTDRDTALHSAAYANNASLVEYLLALRPAAICARNAWNNTPFDCALIAKSDNVVKTILTLMPDFNNIDSKGNTMLHIAAKHCSLQEDESTMQRVFDSHTKDIKTSNTYGDTPYHIARAHNNLYAIRILHHNLTVADLFDIHTQYNPLDTSELKRSVAKECVSLDTYLLPDLHFLVQEFLGTSQKNKKRKKL